MTGSILKIKTSIPPLSPRIMERGELLTALAPQITTPNPEQKLILFSAPAGYGKTSLIRSLIQGHEDKACWFSIDENDNDSTRFWLHIIAALQQKADQAGQVAAEVLKSIGTVDRAGSINDQVLTPLLNDLFTLDAHLLLVLDDYHVITNSVIHDSMTWFLENLPPGIQLLLGTRSDPPWPLSRWRSKSMIHEIRIDKLRFSAAETRSFLESSTSGQLTPDNIDLLHRKTEGWPAGLQLVTVSLSQALDPQAFIAGFGGTNRHILHFLSEEILDRLSPELADFIAQIAILRRFCAPLCDALSGQNNSAVLIDELERKNLFVIRLDDQGIWFRFHALFGDLLSHILTQQPRIDAVELHSRAAKWHLDRQDYSEALVHALGSANHDLLCSILAAHYDSILFNDGPGMLITYLEQIPKSVLGAYPLLVLHTIIYYLNYHGFSRAREYMEYFDGLQLPKDDSFKAMTAVVKTFYLVYQNDFGPALEQAETALKLLDPRELYWRMRINVYCGDIRFFQGQISQSRTYYQRADDNARQTAMQFFPINTALKLATSLYYAGDIVQASKIVHAMLKDTAETGLARLPRVGLLWGLAGEIERQKGNLAQAAYYLERALVLGASETPSRAWNMLYYIALLASEARFREALEICQQLESEDRASSLPAFIISIKKEYEADLAIRDARPLRAMELYPEFGDLQTPTPPAAAEAIPPGQERAALLVIKAQLTTATLLDWQLTTLGQIQAQALENGQIFIEIESTLITSYYYQLSQEWPQAVRQLHRALSKAWKCGIYQLCVDQSGMLFESCQILIQDPELAPPGSAFGGYLERLNKQLFGPRDETKEQPAGLDSSLLVEELSGREMEILALVARGLSNDDIGSSLYISTGTVKWHISNIFAKLGVNKRTRAVALAREMHLLDDIQKGENG